MEHSVASWAIYIWHLISYIFYCCDNTVVILFPMVNCLSQSTVLLLYRSFFHQLFVILVLFLRSLAIKKLLVNINEYILLILSDIFQSRWTSGLLLILQLLTWLFLQHERWQFTTNCLVSPKSSRNHYIKCQILSKAQNNYSTSQHLPRHLYYYCLYYWQLQ